MSSKIKIKKKPSGGRTKISPGAVSQPWGKWIASGVGFLVVAAIVGVIALTPEPLEGVPDGTETVAVGEPQHVEGEIHEEGEVPAGGEHNPVWLNCGYYDAPVDSEFAVHSLEHGAVWITYNPGIGDGEIDRLRGFVGRAEKVIVSPILDLDSPILVTAWGQQLSLDSADDERLGQFTNEFAGSANAPEPGGSCNGGAGTPSF